MRAFVVLIFCLGLMPTPAFAYIDPGLGAYAVQGILAVLAGATLTLRSFRVWVAARVAEIGRKFDKSKARDKSASDDGSDA